MLSSVVIAAAEEQHNPLIPAWPDIIGALICFLIILFFFWKLVLPRMRKLLDERAEAIEGNIEKADEAQRKAEELLEQYTAQLADARAEAAKIRETARNDGQKIVAEAKDNATAEVVPLAPGFWRVSLNYGFMNVPDVPGALARIAGHGIDFEPMRTSYFISREVVVPTRGTGMAQWRERLFATMSRNAGSAVEFFKLPNNAVIELGTRVQI